MSTLLDAPDIGQLLNEAITAIAETDGFVPAQLVDFAGITPPAEAAAGEVAAGAVESGLGVGAGLLGGPAILLSQLLPVQGGSGSEAGAVALAIHGPNGYPLWRLPDGRVELGGPRGATGVAAPPKTIATAAGLSFAQYTAFQNRLNSAFLSSHGNVPGVARAAPPSHGGLLLGLLPFAGALVLLGLVHAARALVAAVGGIIGAATGVVPFVGPFVSGGTAAATHLAVSALATAESHLDPLIAGFWQDAAKLASWAWRELTGGAAISQTLAHLAHAAAVTARARRPSPHAVGRISAIAAYASHSRAFTKALGAAIAHPGSTSIGAAIATRLEPLRLRALNTEARLHGADARIAAGRSRAVEAQVGGLHAETRRLQGELDAQAARTAQLEKTVAAAGGAALFVSGARRIGAGWLQCRNWRRLGRNVCGLPSNLLNDFMALLLDFLVLENICVVLPWITEAASVVGVPLVEGLAAVVGAGACGGAARSPALKVPRLYCPPARPLALHLPG